MREHGAGGLLGARPRNRKHGENRKRLFGARLAFEEIPGVALVLNADGHGLGGVDDGAAAHGDDGFHALIADPVDGVANEVHARIGLHAALFNRHEAFALEALQHPVEQPRAAGAAAAVEDKNFSGTAERFANDFACALFCAAPENESRGIVVAEVEHDEGIK